MAIPKKIKQKEYDHLRIEKKWQKEWDAKKVYAAGPAKAKKFFGLIEFPYPSGAGLHVGHIRSNTAMDIVTRKRRMQGFNVLYPIGWDAFGLPTEQYAIKTGTPPKEVTKRNTDIFRKQLKSVGFGFDWSREINTTDPSYYKWTQWLFLQFYKKGLAYKATTTINWCPKDKIGLANEEVVDGTCERCGEPTEKRDKEQWMLAITKYADRLDKDLDDVDYPDRVKAQQRNWIGKSEGSEIPFSIISGSFERSVTVFTTRADTLLGVTYVVLAPEHPLVVELSLIAKNKDEIHAYVSEARKKDEMDRTGEGKEKTGVELKGVRAINPVNGEFVPVWIADYVLPNYGTGAVMAVPAHDERDAAFAEKYGLPSRIVVDGFSADFRDEMTEKSSGKKVTKFKLRDWVFSRQRYWGEPIPLVHCADCGWVPVPEKELPVLLPTVGSYTPTDTGESPLALMEKWVKTKCPKCKGPARRETDTMPNWAGSSWYYLRYADSKNKSAFADKKKLKYWTPVDWYNGGMEHTTLHLLYSRFWHKFFYDLKLVPTKEPYKKRTSHGMILAEGGAKMSKSKGNVVNPDDIVKTYGADTLRLYEMFMGPFDQAVVWSTDAMIGPRRFIERVWRLQSQVTKGKLKNPDYEVVLNQTIQKVSDDIESMGFNTAVSQMMICVNTLEKSEQIAIDDFKKFLQVLAPFTPHVADEIWQNLGEKKTIHRSSWPKHNPKKLVSDTMKIMVQVNGKVRGEVNVARDAGEVQITALAYKDERVSAALAGATPKRVIYVAGRLINFVI